MLTISKLDRASKVIEFCEPSIDDCCYDGAEYARRWLVTNLHCTTLILCGWTVNGVRLGDAGITAKGVRATRAALASQLTPA
jgi:hypothetical protein